MYVYCNIQYVIFTSWMRINCVKYRYFSVHNNKSEKIDLIVNLISYSNIETLKIIAIEIFILNGKLLEINLS